ncbi:MAG: hypothetical protein O7B79_06530 [SAR324 cluster bacterium]|nr:hypothetical protein [SAR324 cluster bacterium]
MTALKPYARLDGTMILTLLHSLKSLFTGSAPPPAVALSGFSTEQLQKCHAAGVEAQALWRSLASEGRTPVDVVMNGNPFAKWDMYPWQGGILDQRTSSQYFYHSHPDFKGEHGHFHTFYYQKRKMAHLVAIGMDGKGRINNLYTFNRWSPGDTYFPARTLKTFLPRFRVTNSQELDKRLHGFINNVLVLFRPEIELLFDQREETFDRYRKRQNGQSPYEDRSLEITSSLAVDLDVQVARIARELDSRGASAQTGAAPAAPAPVPEALETVELPEITEIPLEQLKRSYQAGLALRAGMEKLKAGGGSVISLVMDGKELEDWEMYPWDGGIFDKKTRSQYYYHSHPQSPEHGHFHAFFHHGKQLAHLVAVAMDNQGEPLELFTVNRWVTDDVNLPPQKLKSYLPRFQVGSQRKYEDVHNFLRDIFALYQPDIGMLLERREQVFKTYRLAHNGQQPYEDRALEVTSSLPTNVGAQISRLEAELKRRGAM